MQIVPHIVEKKIKRHLFYWDTNTFRKERLLARCCHVINACDISSYKQAQNVYIPLHLPLFDGHLKYLLNFSTKATKLEVVPTNSPSGTFILEQNDKQKLKIGDDYITSITLIIRFNAKINRFVISTTCELVKIANSNKTTIYTNTLTEMKKTTPRQKCSNTHCFTLLSQAFTFCDGS